MTWIDLVKNEINSLEKKKVKIKTQLDKIRDDDSVNSFEKIVSLMAEMKAIDEAIHRFHVLIGKQDMVDE